MLSGELNALTQGADKLVIPCLWKVTHQLVIVQIAIFFLTTNPTVGHSFSFFKTGVLVDAVTVTTSGQFWRTNVNFALKGQTDYVTVRHDTNAQDAQESASHVDEGGRIWASLIPQQI